MMMELSTPLTNVISNVPSPDRTVGAMLPHPARITAIQEEAYAIATYSLVFEDESVRAAYRFAPGQFNMLYLPGIGEAAISVSSNPAEAETLGHTIRYAGNVTRAISRLRVGDVLGVRGPYGSKWPLASMQGKDIYIVTGGIGLAPLRPVLYEIMNQRDDFGRVFLLYGARTPPDMLYTQAFDRWRDHDIVVHTTVDRADEQWRGHVGVVPMLFYQLRPNPEQSVVLTCGPEIMMRFVIYEALARRIPEKQIYVSMERNMKCALGFCGHCQFGPMFVCKEGPVFSYADIESFFSVENF